MSMHSRKPSSRAALPRRTTRGPLDADDLLSPSSTLTSPAAVSPALSRTGSVASNELAVEDHPANTGPIPSDAPKPAGARAEEKDLSFMLDPAIYHVVSQLEVPAPLRRPFPVSLTASTNVSDALQQLENLLTECNFLGAAFLSSSLLACGSLKSADRAIIFRVLAVRYSCLELSGNALLAAQEAKALEDLGSGFYYEGLLEDEPSSETESERQLPKHIMPFTLRLQALRLQSIGFSDPRRGVSALYDLGLECRENIASTQNSETDRQAWTYRLEEVGIRVVSALVEMGDLDCARRTLDLMKPSDNSSTAMWTFRMTMVCLKIGLTDRAQSLAKDTGLEELERIILSSLLAIANDDLDAAVQILSTDTLGQHQGLLALAKQNLAVALLYRGEIERARSILDDLIDDHESFQTLTINLATLYDLTSDRSKNLKMALANGLAAQGKSLKQPRSFNNADFKL